MASEKSRSDESKHSDDCLNSTISSSTLEIMIDDPSSNNTDDDDFLHPDRPSDMGSKNTDRSSFRKKKQIPLRNPKSHRLIEKRRRDRMNAHLGELLQLIPHEPPQSQRRIEKTEIIEMAIKHMRHLLSISETKSKNDGSSLDIYRRGYENALVDVHELFHDHVSDEQMLMTVANFFKAKEADLQALINIPDKKRSSYTVLADQWLQPSRPAFHTPSEPVGNRSTLRDRADERLCVISEVLEQKHDPSQTASKEHSVCDEPSDPVVKVPVFVLHPSGTHYIPMCIDASLVSHAFEKKSTVSRPSSTADPVQCHPVSIPVNFNPPMSLSDPYELDIQNINVIGTRHQTSVRPS